MDLAKKVEVRHDAGITARGSKFRHMVRVEVSLKDGTRLERSSRHNDPDVHFTVVPEGIMVYANFIHSAGLLKVKPATWKDVFVSEVQGLPGN